MILLGTQMIWMIFIKILKNATQRNSRKYYSYLMKWLLIRLVIKNLIRSIVTELFIRGKKFNIYCVFITQSYFADPKNIRLTSTHYFVMKILDKRELQQVAFNHLWDIEFQDFMYLSEKCVEKPCFFLVTDPTLASDNSSLSRNNLSERT